MKLTKAMKKLKFWSKKKKKKRVPLLDRPPSPPPPLLPCYYHCPYNYPVQPSAPPLPPWFEYVQPYDDSIFTTEQGSGSGSTADSSRQTHGSTNSQHIDNVGEINQPKPTPSDNTLPQQYMVQNQVYGVPVIAEARTERGAGAFGCVINFGAHLFRCFFPCFHIRELK
ncbi:uncharacterized protein LOC107025782 [Solanum pennellii]|uniref:Uncharacterized protein LOC107025782 n=1 Tax=Solanum pennellii TaxID=28526 RepID=A0ABM1H8N8_SOLPN|nr:uncharacterized protein LOC107025782 [Solanum pennellii]